MKNKVLVKVYVPEFELSYDIFIPVNEYIWRVKELIIKSINDLENLKIDLNHKFILVNKDNGTIYDNNSIVYKTDIRNASDLLLISTTM